MADEDIPASKKPRLSVTENELSQNVPTVNEDSNGSMQTGESDSSTKESQLPKATQASACGQTGVSRDVEKPVGECDVGITEYISVHEGFHGIIKHRFSDFLVNEIDLDGSRVCLTDMSSPADEIDKEDSLPEGILSDDQAEALAKLEQSKEKADTVEILAGDDKQKRSLIHSAIRQKYPLLESSTSDRDGQKFIVVCRSTSGNQRGGKSKQSRRQETWIHSGKDYCHFCLYKENLDTMEAVNVISKLLRIKPSMINYAGTKDKRAKTCQRLSVYRITASRIHALNKRLRNMAVGNFCYKKNSLSLGDLKGNHFTVILRNVTGSSEQVEEAVSSLERSGFINYFGMQRFGTSSVPTHQVGRAMLKSNWQEAIELILKPRQGTNSQISAARQSWWENRDASKALGLLGTQQCPERYLLMGLKQRPATDLVGALGFISRNQRTMYVHAYQSCIWNKMVSQRYTEFGLKPVVGDLALKMDGPQGNDGLTEKREFVHPTVVTEENLSSFTIRDVVLPLPGYDVVFPDNVIGRSCVESLKADELTIQDLKHKVKDYSLRGQYRHVVVLPTDLGWELSRYDDGHESLVQSDLDKLNQSASPPRAKSEGEHQALKLEFSLPSSTYATMALREVLKQDTSAANQTLLTATCK